MKKAFTLIELIFVIVILGILSTIGTQIFINLYSSYTLSKIQNNLQIKTETVLDQIVNRLAYRIKNSTIFSTNKTNFTSLESANFQAANGIYALEWIGYDNDSRRGMATAVTDSYISPSWSGLIDLQASNANAIIDPALNGMHLRDSILSLSYGSIDINTTSTMNAAVIIYPYAQGSVADYGWYNTASPSLVHPVMTLGNTLVPIIIAPNTFRGINNEVFEHYYLAYSAFAIEYNPPVGSTASNLMLYYNYQPWNNEIYTDGNHSMLVEDVTTFKLLQIGTLIKVQLCLGLSLFERSAYGEDYSICKEQAVF